MKYREALEMNLSGLKENGYSEKEIERKRDLLRNWLSYALALFSLRILGVLEKIDQPFFITRRGYITMLNEQKEKRYSIFWGFLKKREKKLLLSTCIYF